MKTRAFSYWRFSDVKQSKGDSRRRQMDWGPKICEAKGWLLDQSLKLSDEGVSAFRGRNAATGALAAFLQAIKTGKVIAGDVLLVESLDRLSREEIDPAYDLFRSILKAGVSIQTREPERFYQKENLNNIASILEALIYMERANNESRTKSMCGAEWWKNRRSKCRAGAHPVIIIAQRG